ncbi:c-type cytochrome [Mucilaginibacter sp. McL0603]|uniref:c-type cytochrome n=1 Tax=Mucilaginibacter sp. McL0603 TaxID=3415670 RepID=UPI003CF7CBA3
MKPKFIYPFLLLGLFLFSFMNFKPQENNPPVVKIISPQNNSTFDSNVPVTYKIAVSDKEDGDSKFDELNAKEVLLEVRRITKSKPASNKVVPSDPGLTVIMTSNCINCHNFNSKSIGPSLYEINKRYPVTKANTDTLIKRIREGSSGLWGGKEKMPTHHELTVVEIKNAVQWILKNAADPNVSYYTGLEGFFRISSANKGAYILTASYTDHGLKDVPGKRLRATDAVTIQSK